MPNARADFSFPSKIVCVTDLGTTIYPNLCGLCKSLAPEFSVLVSASWNLCVSGEKLTPSALAFRAHSWVYRVESSLWQRLVKNRVNKNKTSWHLRCNPPFCLYLGLVEMKKTYTNMVHQTPGLNTSEGLFHNLPLPGFLDHALPVLNHDRTDHSIHKTNGALVYSNSSVIQFVWRKHFAGEFQFR